MVSIFDNNLEIWEFGYLLVWVFVGKFWKQKFNPEKQHNTNNTKKLITGEQIFVFQYEFLLSDLCGCFFTDSLHGSNDLSYSFVSIFIEGHQILSMKKVEMLFFLSFIVLLSTVSCFEVTFEVSPDGDGLFFFLLFLFYSLFMCTPLFVWLYHFYISKAMEKAEKVAGKLSRKISEHLSDAGWRVSQSIRSEWKKEQWQKVYYALQSSQLFKLKTYSL